VVLPYYRRLNRRQQAIYRHSDALVLPALGAVDEMRRLAAEVENALGSDEPRTVGPHVRRLTAALTVDLAAPPVRVSVRARRPANAEEELHGLYEPVWVDEDGADHLALITVWMRTVAHGRVVRFRTFMRTVLHELVHHLDYELLGLEDSFHTEGFFKRESALMRQLCPRAAPADTGAQPDVPAARSSIASVDASPGKRPKQPALTEQLSFVF
jgi:hypothetical protein